MAEYEVLKLADHPDLMPGVDALALHWEAFMREDDISASIFARLFDWFLSYQRVLVTADREVVGRALCIPIRWDGDDATLPDTGWNWALLNGVETYKQEAEPNAISAIEISIAPGVRGQGLSTVLLKAMKAAAVEKDIRRMVAPVRPSLKSRYPLTPTVNYIRWTRQADGAPFDPWLRVHQRAGAKMVGVASRSMRVTGTVADWEGWAEMSFPETGRYIVSGALSPVEIDREADLGVYVEPNVWMVHPVE